MTSSDMSSCQEKEHEPRTTEEDMTFLTIGVLLGLVPHWRVTITMDHPLDGGWRNRGAGDMSNHKMRSEHINLLELKSSLSNPQVILVHPDLLGHKSGTYIIRVAQGQETPYNSHTNSPVARFTEGNSPAQLPEQSGICAIQSCCRRACYILPFFVEGP